MEFSHNNVEIFRIDVEIFHNNVAFFRIDMEFSHNNVEIFRINVAFFHNNVGFFRIDVENFRILLVYFHIEHLIFAADLLGLLAFGFFMLKERLQILVNGLGRVYAAFGGFMHGSVKFKRVCVRNIGGLHNNIPEYFLYLFAQIVENVETIGIGIVVAELLNAQIARQKLRAYFGVLVCALYKANSFDANLVEAFAV
jgi:hypothetical protein